MLGSTWFGCHADIGTGSLFQAAQTGSVCCKPSLLQGTPSTSTASSHRLTLTASRCSSTCTACQGLRTEKCTAAYAKVAQNLIPKRICREVWRLSQRWHNTVRLRCQRCTACRSSTSQTNMQAVLNPFSNVSMTRPSLQHASTSPKLCLLLFSRGRKTSASGRTKSTTHSTARSSGTRTSTSLVMMHSTDPSRNNSMHIGAILRASNASTRRSLAGASWGSGRWPARRGGRRKTRRWWPGWCGA
mmetsp:Transcript_14317/g.28540  ORF Transcript_14317/g.28540 Transcript_14317/m.28540 type:complete len:244 (+) Transcript_14317:355-1086(+)